jgi:NAD-dependent SIR2 family protein deacetylase
MADRTDRNVFILGAGFSADAGAPLVRNFLDVSRELFDDPNSGLDIEERTLFRTVFDFRKQVAQAREKFEIDLDNIEELFGLVEMSQRLRPEMAGTRDATVYVIAKTLELSVKNYQHQPWANFSVAQNYRLTNLPWISKVPRQQGGDDRFQWEVYKHFAFLLAGEYDDPLKAKFRSNVVITFNYDLVLDHVLEELRIKHTYGFEGDSASGELSLLKLHGSTNWASCPSCKRVNVMPERLFAPPSQFQSQGCQYCGTTALRRLLVPPSWDKSEYQSALQPVWKKAMEEIQRATRICIIGYSMPEMDSFFKYLLTLGLAENDQLYKLIVVDKAAQNLQSWNSSSPDVDPTVETVEHRYRRMLAQLFAKKRFYFSNDGFSFFLQRAASTWLNRAETIMPQ